MESSHSKIHRGEILGFKGSWASGMAMLLVNRIVEIGPDREPVYEMDNVLCDNGPTVRALEAAYPGFIAEGHTVDSSAITGHEIYYTYDDMGLMLAGFTPVEIASEKMEAAWIETVVRDCADRRRAKESATLGRRKGEAEVPDMKTTKEKTESVTQSQPQESTSTPTQEKSPSSERVFPPGMPQELKDFLIRVKSKHKPMKPGEMRIWIPSDNPRVPKRGLKE